MKRVVQLCAVLLIASMPALGQTQHDNIRARGSVANTQIYTLSGATPSVAIGNVFKISNGGPVTITNFLGGVDSQRISLICDNQATIQNNGNIVVTGGTNFSCAANVVISFVYKADIAMWLEDGGTGNGGGGGSPGAPAQSFQCNDGANHFVACAAVDTGTTIAVNEDFRSRGPNPEVYITAYGARASNPNATPAAIGLTANCNSVTNPTQVTISAASTFLNPSPATNNLGDGAVLYG